MAAAVAYCTGLLFPCYRRSILRSAALLVTWIDIINVLAANVCFRKSRRKHSRRHKTTPMRKTRGRWCCVLRTRWCHDSRSRHRRISMMVCVSLSLSSLAYLIFAAVCISLRKTLSFKLTRPLSFVFSLAHLASLCCLSLSFCRASAARHRILFQRTARLLLHKTFYPPLPWTAVDPHVVEKLHGIAGMWSDKHGDMAAAFRAGIGRPVLPLPVRLSRLQAHLRWLFSRVAGRIYAALRIRTHLTPRCAPRFRGSISLCLLRRAASCAHKHLARIIMAVGGGFCDISTTNSFAVCVSLVAGRRRHQHGEHLAAFIKNARTSTSLRHITRRPRGVAGTRRRACARVIFASRLHGAA